MTPAYERDADIRDFFSTIDHGWMVKFLTHRIADRRIHRLVQKWLRAGVSEDGTWAPTDVGTPQGAVASPLLANVYLHYVFDLWVRQWRRRSATGDMIVVRYADDLSWDSSIGQMRNGSSKTGGNACDSAGWNFTRTKRA